MTLQKTVGNLKKKKKEKKKKKKNKKNINRRLNCRWSHQIPLNLDELLKSYKTKYTNGEGGAAFAAVLQLDWIKVNTKVKFGDDPLCGIND